MGNKETLETKAKRAQRDRDRKLAAKEDRKANPNGPEAVAYRKKQAETQQKARKKKAAQKAAAEAMSTPSSADKKPAAVTSIRSNALSQPAPGSPKNRAMIPKYGDSDSRSTNASTSVGAVRAPSSTPHRFRSSAIQQSVERMEDYVTSAHAHVDKDDAELKQAQEEQKAERERRKKERREKRERRAREELLRQEEADNQDKAEDDADDAEHLEMIKDRLKEKAQARASITNNAFVYETEHQRLITEHPELFSMEDDPQDFHLQPSVEHIDRVENGNEEDNYEAAVVDTVHASVKVEPDEDAVAETVHPSPRLQEINRDLPPIVGSPNNDDELERSARELERSAHASTMQNGGNALATEAARAKAFFQMQTSGSTASGPLFGGNGGAASASGPLFGGNGAASASGADISATFGSGGGTATGIGRPNTFFGAPGNTSGAPVSSFVFGNSKSTSNDGQERGVTKMIRKTRTADNLAPTAAGMQSPTGRSNRPRPPSANDNDENYKPVKRRRF